MSQPSVRARGVLDGLLSDPGAIVVVVAVYVAAGVGFVVTDYTLNDEGLLTCYWASWARQDFLPVFFFQKVHPVVSALYAIISAGGVRATLVAHVIVGAAAVPMLAATARSLGHRLPNLPALVVALSPLYFYGGPAGFSNVDGVVGMTLVLYLLCVRRMPLVAGLIVGLLPWVRLELAIFSAVMALYALATERERPMLLGMAVFPLAYVGAGALYHRDALWFVHFPPSAPFDPANPIYQTQLIGLRYFLEPAAAVTPIAALAVACPFRRLRRVERALLPYALLTVVVIDVLPIFRIGNFGAAPRYLLHLLPALALFVGRAVEPWWEGERPSLTALLGTSLLAVWLATRQLDGRATGILIFVYALLLCAAWLRAGALAAGLAVALTVAGPLLPLRTDVGRGVDAKYLLPMVAWLQAHPEQITGPIYTNSQLLAPFLERRLPGANVYFMAGIDQTREMVMLTNPDIDQRERIRRLCAIDFYGKMLLGPIAPEDIPANALLALSDDKRARLLLPDATWSPRLEVLADTPNYRMARLRPTAAATRP